MHSKGHMLHYCYIFVHKEYYVYSIKTYVMFLFMKFNFECEQKITLSPAKWQADEVFSYINWLVL